MSLLGGVILAAAALVLHLILTLAAAPLVAPLAEQVAGMLTGGWREPPNLSRRTVAAMMLAPWHALRDLMGKETVRAGAASPVSAAAPVLSLAVTLLAGALVPSFAFGMLTAPLCDLTTILALLAAARALMLLGACDAGIAGPGLAAASSAVGLLLAVPGCALALYALSAAVGGTSLDHALSELHGGPGRLVAVGLGLAALAASGNEAVLSDPLSGPDLALFRFQAAMQRLIWIDLVTALLLPETLTAAATGPLQWLLALLLWIGRLVAGCVVLGGMRELAATAVARRRLAGLSVLLGALAPLLLLVEQGAG